MSCLKQNRKLSRKCSCVPAVCTALLCLFEKRFIRTGEKAQQLRTLYALQRTQVLSPAMTWLSVIAVLGGLTPSSGLHEYFTNTRMVCLHTRRQNTHIKKK